MGKKTNFFISFIVLYIITTFTFNSTSYADKLFDYTVENGYATITAYKGTKSDIVVPNVIDKYKVVAIGQHAFDQKFNPATNGHILTSVTVSSGIVSIGDFAFVDCTSLTAVKLPDTVRNLGDQTFIGCSNLKYINIPDGVQSLGFTGYMFQETALENITIPKSVTKIPTGTFRICKNLKTITIYSKNVDIASDAFEHCSPNLVIYGFRGSTSQSFAINNKMKFVDLSNTKANVPVTKIVFHKQHFTVEVGKITQARVNIVPTNATNKNLVYKSANPKIAYINNKGYVKGMAAGTTTLSVSSPDGKIRSFTKVTVTEPASIKQPIPEPTKSPIYEPTKAPIQKPTIIPYTKPTGITDPGAGITPPDVIGATPDPTVTAPTDPTTSATPPVLEDMPTTGGGDTTTIGALPGDNPEDSSSVDETNPNTEKDSPSTSLVSIIAIILAGVLIISASVIVIKKKRGNNQ